MKFMSFKIATFGQNQDFQKSTRRKNTWRAQSVKDTIIKILLLVMVPLLLMEWNLNC